jgi:hypothetical protein
MNIDNNLEEQEPNDWELDEMYNSNKTTFFTGDDEDEDEDDDFDELETVEIDDDPQAGAYKDDEDVHKKAPKLIGKHSLKHDSIFKGKKMKALEEDDFEEMLTDYKFGDTLPINQSTYIYHETHEAEDYQKMIRRKEGVYKVISEKTNLNLESNRRKPSKKDFNEYFLLVVNELKSGGFSKVELFDELSGYFSENTGNMFSLLNPDARDSIMSELNDKVNKANRKRLEDLNFVVPPKK